MFKKTLLIFHLSIQLYLQQIKRPDLKLNNKKEAAFIHLHGTQDKRDLANLYNQKEVFNCICTINFIASLSNKNMPIS